MKKLLIVSPDYPPAQGGVEIFVESLANNLPEDEFDVRVLAGTRVNTTLKKPTREKRNNILVQRIPTFTLKGLDFPRSITSYWLIWKQLKEADLVHLNDVRCFFISTVLLKLFYRYDLFLTTHGFIFHTKRHLALKNLYMSFFSFCARHLPINVVTNGATDEKYCELKKIPHQRINMGIPLNKWTQIKRTPRKNIFLYFGRIDKNKNLTGLIHSLSYYAKRGEIFELKVCGKGDPKLMNELEMETSKLGMEKQITWLGSIPEAELKAYVGEAEFVFIPSLFESFGFTFIESLAAGCTVIAHHNEQFKSLIGNDNAIAYLIDINHPQELIGTIGKARITYSAINTRGVEFASQFNEKNVITRYTDLFSKH